MTGAEIISLSSLLSGLTVTAVVAFNKLEKRVAKQEAHSDVCNEKHTTHEKKFMKQDGINLQAEKNHVEVMIALAKIDTNVTILKEKI